MPKLNGLQAGRTIHAADPRIRMCLLRFLKRVAVVRHDDHIDLCALF
jgi:hypothetical protein